MRKTASLSAGKANADTLFLHFLLPVQEKVKRKRRTPKGDSVFPLWKPLETAKEGVAPASETPPERKKTVHDAFAFRACFLRLFCLPPCHSERSEESFFFRFFVTSRLRMTEGCRYAPKKKNGSQPSPCSRAAAVGRAAQGSERLRQGCPGRIVFRLGAESCRSSPRDRRRSPGESSPRARSFRFTFLSRERKVNKTFVSAQQSPGNQKPPATGSIVAGGEL